MAAPIATYVGAPWAEWRGQNVIELVQLTGGAGGTTAGEQVTYIPRFGHLVPGNSGGKIVGVIGAVGTVTPSVVASVTIASPVAIAAGVKGPVVEIIYLAGSP